MRNVGMRRAVVLLLLAGAACVSAQVARGQGASQPAPKGSESKAVVYNGNMDALLQHLAQAYDVTIGFDAGTRQARPQVHVDVRDATLQDVLDAVVRSQPAYRWRQYGSFFDVYPAEGGSPLLDTTVGSLQLSASRWAEAADALLGLPEVQSRASAMNLTRAEAQGVSAGAAGEVFSLRLANVPVRTALHEMTKRSGGHFWVFRQDGGKTFLLGTTYR